MTEIEHGPLSEMTAMLIATTLAIVGVSVGYLMYRKGPEKGQALAKLLAPIHHLMMHKFYVDELYGILFVTPFRWISLFLAKFIDVKVIDGLVLLPSRVCRAGGTLLSFVQWGAAQFYLLLMLVGSLLLMWVALRGVVI
jgi:NADH-quinone oxidoreductase subunit L